MKLPALCVVGALAAVASFATPAFSEASETARNKEIITAQFDRWAAGGNTFFTDVLTPEIVWTIEGTGPSSGVFRGRADFFERALKPFATRLSVPVRPITKQVWAEGSHVIVYWKGEGRAADGAPYRNSYAWIFRMQGGLAVEVTAFLDLAPYDEVLQRLPGPIAAANYVGMWVTADGNIRQELLPSGRYDEARGTRQSAYRGRYQIIGDRIAYWDDTGFTADGVFVSADELHHGGMIFYRRK